MPRTTIYELFKIYLKIQKKLKSFKLNLIRERPFRDFIFNFIYLLLINIFFKDK